VKRLQDNPVGMVLVGLNGVLVLLGVILAIVRALPVVVEPADITASQSDGEDVVLVAHEAGAMSKFQIINQKPVFNESRLPMLVTEDDELAEDDTVSIQRVPDVRLTGIIITPEQRIASLTPAGGKKESLMAYEGELLSGEYVGWQVSLVKPRNVILESRDGQVVELELQVHDAKIKEPPKPPKPVPADVDGQAQDADEAPLSRAEQIRQRIAERREELRREQEDQQGQDGKKPGRAAKSKEYQNAIRALMGGNRSKDTAGNDNKDG